MLPQNIEETSHMLTTLLTSGIWMCRGRDMNVLVMDVEGTDGRERGEDQVRLLNSRISGHVTVPLRISNANRLCSPSRRRRSL